MLMATEPGRPGQVSATFDLPGYPVLAFTADRSRSLTAMVCGFAPAFRGAGGRAGIKRSRTDRPAGRIGGCTGTAGWLRRAFVVSGESRWRSCRSSARA